MTSTFVVQLRRHDSSTIWGFDIDGGISKNKPIYVRKLQNGSAGARNGIERGDVLARIGAFDTQQATLEQAKSAMMREGNELDLTLIRGLIPPPPKGAPKRTGSSSASGVSEEHIMSLGGGNDVTTKTFEVLKQELPDSERGGAAPSSIFGRKKDERSAYMNQSQNPFQKVLGEK